MLQLRDKSRGETVAQRVITADGFWQRLKGLMFTGVFPSCDGMLIEPCSGIHTFFMRYSIDVLLLDRTGRVIFKKEELRPYRWTPLFSSAQTAVELPAGTLKKTAVDTGDEILIIEK